MSHNLNSTLKLFSTNSTFPVINACALINCQSSNLGFRCAISGFWINASFFKGLNKPVFLKLFSIIFEISNPTFKSFNSLEIFCSDVLSTNNGETATGRGFRLPLVMSTSIKASTFVINIDRTKNVFKIIYFINFTFLSL